MLRVVPLSVVLCLSALYQGHPFCSALQLPLLSRPSAASVQYVQQYVEQPGPELAPIMSHALLPTQISDHFLLLSLNNQLEVRSQGQQMRDAMVLKTMRGTEWRIVEERGPAMGSTRQCTATGIFSGFVDEPNKGTMNYKSSQSCDAEQSFGRWVTKPSEIRRGAVQLSARWKVKLPAGQFIYKGFIQADGSTLGMNGAVSAEMTGQILTGEEVGKEKVVGRFRADLIRQFDSTDVKIGQSNGPIMLTPRVIQPSSDE